MAAQSIEVQKFSGFEVREEDAQFILKDFQLLDHVAYGFFAALLLEIESIQVSVTEKCNLRHEVTIFQRGKILSRLFVQALPQKNYIYYLSLEL